MVALTMQKVKDIRWQGVEVVPYGVSQGSTPGEGSVRGTFLPAGFAPASVTG